MAKREWVVKNSAAIPADSRWYPLTETGAPSRYQIANYLPFRSITVENKSGESFDVILDPVVNTSNKEQNVADGKTMNITAEENITFHQVLLINTSALETAIGELKVTVRNY